MAHNILPPGSPDFSQSQQMSCIATECKNANGNNSASEDNQQSSLCFAWHQPEQTKDGQTQNTTSISFGRACINKVGGAISNYCTPPCAAAQLLSLSSVFVTKWTVRRDDGHQLQVRADQRKVRGAVLIYYARQQADHQGTQVVTLVHVASEIVQRQEKLLRRISDFVSLLLGPIICTMLGPLLLRTLVNQSDRRYNTYQLVAKELWLRKQTSPSGCALGIGSFTAIIP